MSRQDIPMIGSRLELFVDDWLIDRLDGAASRRLHEPVPREVVLRTDRPWEGCMCGYVSVFRDGDLYRMTYHGWDIDLGNSSGESLGHSHPFWICTATSPDGLSWHRPSLGLVEYEGSTDNNILWDGGPEKHSGLHGFTPFVDTHPDCPPEHRYKAVGAIGYHGDGLYAMSSPDGLHWSLMQDGPVLPKTDMLKFDSQNQAFYDATIGAYRCYMRAWSERQRRDIATSVSDDFLNWSDPELLDFPGAPPEELYTNQVQPYYRAPHILLGFPTRYVERPWSEAIEQLPEPDHRRLRADVNERFGAALTDGLLMSSRDGRTFQRWNQVYLRPGGQLHGNWAYGDNYQGRGMIETPSALEGAPPELSFYVAEGHWRDGAKVIRRYTTRIDGFVSVHADRRGGDLLTRVLTFEGNRLQLNLSTSAAGSVRVELQNPDGTPIEGFALDDCIEQIGDQLDRTVGWRGGRDVSRLAGHPIRLRLHLDDADVYALQFVEAG